MRSALARVFVVTIAILVSATGARSQCAPAYCDNTISPASGFWDPRFGTNHIAATDEPSVHPSGCADNNASGRIGTGSFGAAVLVSSLPGAASQQRNADISFKVPGSYFADWNHMFVGIADAAFGVDNHDAARLGVALGDVGNATMGHKNRIYVELVPPPIVLPNGERIQGTPCMHDDLNNSIEGVGDGMILFPNDNPGTGETRPQIADLQPNTWYRLAVQVTQRTDTGLNVQATVTSLATGALLGSVEAKFHSECTPPFFNTPADRFVVATLAVDNSTGALVGNNRTYIDDFFMRPDPN